MASGDVALELTSAKVAADSSGHEGGANDLRQRTSFRYQTASSPSVEYIVDLVAASTNSGLPETLFDSTKQYKVTFTEV